MSGQSHAAGSGASTARLGVGLEWEVKRSVRKYKKNASHMRTSWALLFYSFVFK
jgi:hypothetical protein